MNAVLAYVIAMCANLIAGCYLVVAGHPGWAWVPFLIASCIGYREHSESEA